MHIKKSRPEESCPEAYLHTKWHLDASSRLATIKMGRKLGATLPRLFGEGAGSPSSTLWRGPRPTSVSNAILIHPALLPQWICAEN